MEAAPAQSSTPVTEKTEPSDEAKQLADVAADTLQAFLQRFPGQISWASNFPALVTSDDATSRQENAILELLRVAYQERIRMGYQARRDKALRDQIKADRAEDRRGAPNYFEGYEKQMEKMFDLLQDKLSGKKTVRADTPEEQKRLAQEQKEMLRRLGWDGTVQPGESVSPESGPSESTSAATTEDDAEEPDSSADGGP
jgi:hypothetical protein